MNVRQSQCQWLLAALMLAMPALGQSQETQQQRTKRTEPEQAPAPSTVENIPLSPLDPEQLSESALQGLPPEAFTEEAFVDVLVEPVFYSENFSGSQPQRLIRYQQLQLLLEDQELRQQLRPAPMVPRIPLNQNGRQAGPDHSIRTQPQ
ncbi:MAG: hypothetical protein R3296_14410 [Oleiphilaceae bacterium]|nr:hypothetical protein [Oleiphilaceae bacterium]